MPVKDEKIALAEQCGFEVVNGRIKYWLKTMLPYATFFCFIIYLAKKEV